jgi:iron complex outermembrane recepter protein
MKCGGVDRRFIGAKSADTLRVRVSGYLTVLLVTPAVVCAQSSAPAPAATEPDAGPLQEIVVTSTRRDSSLSKVPLSVSAFGQEALDLRGAKDITDVARFTPGLNIDTGGTNNISIRGIASTGGAGTTGIYIDDTPIQMRALALNPDETLPKTFDIDRVEILRGPQGTLFGAGSEGGTVRYITTQPSLTQTSLYVRSEVSSTQGGEPSYEAGVAAGGPLVDGTLGARVSVWYRRDGGWIDRIDPVSLTGSQTNANYDDTVLLRLAGIWAVSDNWTVKPAVYYQDRYRNDVESYWPLYSDPAGDRYVNANPSQRTDPDRFVLPSLMIEGDVGFARLISNTSYFRRSETTGYDGTLFNLGYFQAQGVVPVIPLTSFLPGVLPLLDGAGVHLPPGATNYRAPASIDNAQRNFTQEVRLQSANADSRFSWTTGLFFSLDHQRYLEQIHDPLLNELFLAATGQPYTAFTVDPDGNPVTYDPRFPADSYFLQTNSEDKQLAWFAEASYRFATSWKLTAGARFSKTEFSFDTLTGGPTLFLQPQTNAGDKKENSVTPKFTLEDQFDANNLYYFTYAKGFRPGGANNPVPYAACGTDFRNFGISSAPTTYNSDTVDSFEVGAKNNFNNRVRLATSLYYIRWNNIQQTVLPPICQISFITNLGQAAVKGADVQADVALGDRVTLEFAAGYTDGRYTHDSRLSPEEQSPIVASGDAIVGQSGQPAPTGTASVGIEYHFTAFGSESFIRFDDEYRSRARWVGPQQDPNSSQYDPANYTLSSTTFASLRLGTKFHTVQVALFADNLFDTHTVTNYNWTIDPLVMGASRLQRDFTFRPRTIGVTLTYRR